MLQAKALVYAMVVSLLIAMMSSLLVSLSYIQRLQQIDQFDREQQLSNLESGIALLQASREAQVDAQMLDLYDEQMDQIIINKSDWGLFSAAYVRALSSTIEGTTDTLDKVLLLGEPEQHILDAALYLADLNKPLSLAGKTQIKGRAYVPRAGVKRASVAGQTYQGTQLIYGQQQTSKAQIPRFQKDKLQRFLTRLAAVNPQTDLPSNVSRSFIEAPLLLKGQSLYLYQRQWRGNIMIYGQDTVYLDASNEIEDLIVCAPTVIIGTGFRGSLQAFAFNELIVEEGCQLVYPSVLGTLRADSVSQIPQLQIGPSVLVEGLVFSQEDRFFRQGSRISIGENSLIKGQVYASGTLELAGTVHGNVMCKQFFLRAGGGTYDNHLLGAIIDRSALSPHFVSATTTVEGKQQKIAKCLY